MLYQAETFPYFVIILESEAEASVPINKNRRKIISLSMPSGVNTSSR